MTPHPITRRSLFTAAAGLAACGRRKATGYPGYALVANQDGRSLAAIDLSSFRVRWRVPLEAAPSQVIAHPERPAVLALTPETGGLHEVEPGNARVSRSVRASGAVAMKLAPDGRFMWLLCREPAALAGIQIDTLKPAAHIRLAGTPADFDIGPDGIAAVSLHGEARIVLADLRNGSASRSIAMPSLVSLVAFRSDGRQVIAAHPDDRELTIAQVSSGKTLVRLPLSIEPLEFCFGARGGQLFVSGRGADAVSIVYPYQTEVAETILAGNAPGAMASMESPPYLFVTNPAAGTITVFDIDTRKLMAVVEVGREPASIVTTPDNQYALVVNRGSGDVAVVRIPALAARRNKTAPLFTMISVGAGPVGAAVVKTA